MAKLIPGKIRMEGMTFYEKGQIKIVEVNNRIIYSRVADYNLRYSLADEAVFCSCEFFQEKHYCAHLAGLEYFLKNDTEGKEVLARLELEETSQKETQGRVSFGSLFLDRILPIEEEEPKYRLIALGQEDTYTGDFLWTLRLRRIPDERSYVVRDIRAFLQTIQKEGYYQIGKSYYEPLFFDAFDTASQEFIVFLRGLMVDGEDSSLIFKNAARHLFFPAALFEEGVSRLMELENFRLEYSVFDYSQVYFQDLHEDAGIFSFEIKEHEGYIELEIVEQHYKLLYNGEFLFYDDTFFQLNYQQQRILLALRELPVDSDRKKRLQFDSADQGKLAAGLIEFKKMGRLSAPKEFVIHDFQPTFSFDLLKTGELEVKVVFAYDSLQVSSRVELDSLPFASNFKREQQVFQTLLQAGFEADFESHRSALLPQEIYAFFTHTLDRFRALGNVKISAALESLYQVEKPKMAIETKGSLLEIGFDFANIDQTEVDDALLALFEAQDYFISQTGKVLVFDEETKKISQTLQKLRAKKVREGHVATHRLAAFQLAEVLDKQENVSFSEEFKKLAYDLRHPEEFTLGALNIEAELRDYQEVGIKWLAMLDHYGFGGILADDMGLGKTLQAISFLSTKLTDNKNVLILAPSSLVYNWQEEFAKFTPYLDVAVVYGSKSTRDSLIAEQHQVMITSYTAFRQDVEEYERLSFDYLILDEAQVMKNDQTKIAQHLRKFEVKNTFALSGTPIENHLGELWSIFQIVLPGLLPSKKEFLKMPTDSVSRYIQPFIMRRKKEDVLQELPELTEVVYRNDLVDSQKAIYLAQLQQMQERVLHATDEELNRNKIEILSGLMRLRQICDTPALFLESYQGDSGKLDSLRELLEQIHSSNHRVLIFSQFRGMLDLIEQELHHLGMGAFKITGSTPAKERQEMTMAFNGGEKDAFLISLKAGGVGLNLTGADTVILVDLWWNPAVEAQAIGRAHRIGQERKVEVYRMITRGTIEEKIQELQDNKKNLISTILDGTESRSSLSMAEIREILGISAE